MVGFLATVYGILTRTAYHGVHYFDRRDSRTGLWKDRSGWVPMRVPVIIEEDVFDRVQATLRARNPKVTPPRVVSGPILLTGLARCATCGSGMTLRTGESDRYRFYTCSRHAPDFVDPRPDDVEGLGYGARWQKRRGRTV